MLLRRASAPAATGAAPRCRLRGACITTPPRCRAAAADDKDEDRPGERDTIAKELLGVGGGYEALPPGLRSAVAETAGDAQVRLLRHGSARCWAACVVLGCVVWGCHPGWLVVVSAPVPLPPSPTSAGPTEEPG